MNPKITKLREEHAKNKAKISELSARNRELEKQLRSLENTEIIGLVRAKGMTLEDFAAFMRERKALPVNATNEKEENKDEDEDEEA